MILLLVIPLTANSQQIDKEAESTVKVFKGEVVPYDGLLLSPKTARVLLLHAKLHSECVDDLLSCENEKPVLIERVIEKVPKTVTVTTKEAYSFPWVEVAITAGSFLVVGTTIGFSAGIVYSGL